MGFSRQEYWSGVPVSSPSEILHGAKIQAWFLAPQIKLAFKKKKAFLISELVILQLLKSFSKKKN